MALWLTTSGTAILAQSNFENRKWFCCIAVPFNLQDWCHAGTFDVIASLGRLDKIGIGLDAKESR